MRLSKADFEQPSVERAIVVHGHRRAFTMQGNGPALLLLHGIGCDRKTWDPVLPQLAEHFTVIAPDLLGHGASAKPRADYTLGGYANGMRDLLGILGIERVTVVGHSFGGGVAMQFAYQFPERTERLVLVSSGGLGPDVNVLLRALTLPGGSALIALSHRAPVRLPLRILAKALARVAPRAAAADLTECLGVYNELRDPAARAAFLHVLHHVIDWRGQIVTMRDRAYLTTGVPTLIVWGADDHVLPSRHADAMNHDMPESQLVVMPGVGHFPHRERPTTFAQAVIDFVTESAPIRWDAPRWRALLRDRSASEPDSEPRLMKG
jgi:pimeloyl-ACP methyl ester carboxylesterase